MTGHAAMPPDRVGERPRPVQVDVGELGVVPAAGAKRGDDLVEAGADARHVRLGDAQHGDQIVDRPG